MASTSSTNVRDKKTFPKWEMRKKLTTEELLACLEESDNEEELAEAQSIDIILFPPEADGDTDVDEVPEDENIVTSDSIHLLGPGLLGECSQIEIVTHRSERIELPVETSAKDKKEPKNKRVKLDKPKRSWQPLHFHEEKDEHSHLKIKNKGQTLPNVVEEMLASGGGPIDFFKLFWPLEFVEQICFESKKYATYKDGNEAFRVTPEEFYKFLAILLLSGYVKLPNRRMYWETSFDTFNTAVSSAMSRDRFLQILKYLHFCDNNITDSEDKCRKVRPLLNHMSSKFQEFAYPLPLVWSLDEAMEPYYGRHHFKQFIRGKPIRFGFKFWCLNNPNGYCVKFELYEGKSDRNPKLPLGSSVTKRLVSDFVPEGSEVFLDNYFNSLSLLEDMKRVNIIVTGTIRTDRIENAPLKDLKKHPRGSVYGLTDTSTNVTLIRWHDNSQVTLATNRSDELLNKATVCRRYSQIRKQKVEVLQPSLIQEYNNGMGGVDLFDQWRGRHRINIRSRKWYWPIIRFCINASVVNAWILFRNLQPRMKQIEFIRQIVIPLLSTPKPRTLMPQRTSNVLNDVRYDRVEHWPIKNPTQRRCARCHKCVTFICSKCNVGLHIDCFRPYHTP